RSTYSTLLGTGITVGAISDSFNCYPIYAQNNLPASGPAGYASNGFTTTATQDVSSGDLTTVNVVKEASCLNYGGPVQLPFGDEGGARLQSSLHTASRAVLAWLVDVVSVVDGAEG